MGGNISVFHLIGVVSSRLMGADLCLPIGKLCIHPICSDLPHRGGNLAISLGADLCSLIGQLCIHPIGSCS
jgi:hypothetical protein